MSRATKKKGPSALKLEIREVKALKADDVARLILKSDPWKTLGFKKKDAEVMANMGRTRRSKTGPERMVLGAFIGREMVGFALLSSGFLAGWYLNNLVVSSAKRGEGIGHELMRAAETVVFARSKNFYLCVSSFNQGAQAFYRTLGYKKIGPIVSLLVHSHDEILFRKTTGPLR